MASLLEGAGAEHGVRLRGVQQRAAEAAAADARFKELQHLEEVPAVSEFGSFQVSPFFSFHLYLSLLSLLFFSFTTDSRQGIT